MIFSSEKKELWRYASRNNANCATGSGNNCRPQQLHRHQHLHRLQSLPPDYYLTTNDRLNNSLHQLQNRQLQQQRQQEQQQQQQQQQPIINDEEEIQQSNYNTPPPPYSSVPCGIDYTINACRRMSASNNSENNSIVVEGGVDEDTNYSVDQFSIRSGRSHKTSISNSSSNSIIDGNSSTCRSLSNVSIASYSNHRNNHNQHDYYYNNSNHNNPNNNGEDIMNDFVTYDQLSKTIIPSLQQNQQRSQQQTIMIPSQPTTPPTTTAATLTSTAASVLAATAANIFRNCCGGGNNNNNSSSDSNNCLRVSATAASVEEERVGETPEESTISLSTFMCRQYNVLTPRQYFEALIKQLKEIQVTAMLKAVKSRMELVTALSQQQQQQLQQQTNCCILLHRAPILNEEPYVIACRLFFWYDLKDASELKRLPTCPNACDPIYVCCNPLHWCRIFKTETAPPPYQQRSTASSRLQLEG